MEYEIKPAGRFKIDFSELWEFRELFYFFTWRDIKIKYKQAFLGATWAILQPFLMMLVFTVFFGKALGLNNKTGIPYPMFVYSGLLIWNIFSTGLVNASNSMLVNSNIIKKIYFPRLIIPMSAVLVPMFDFFMALIVFSGMMIYYDFSVSWKIILYLPLSLLITFLTTLGLGAGIAALIVKYRDFKYVVPFFIQLLLFTTPVIYPVSIVPWNWLRELLLYNPMSTAIVFIRSIFDQTVPDLNQFMISFLISIVIFICGIIYFRKTEFYFADLA